MDHHCPWLCSCVGFHNYKYFNLLILYAAILAWTFIFTYWRNIELGLYDDVTAFELYFMGVCYIASILIALAFTLFFGFHQWLISRGYTTLEFCEKKNKKYDDSPYHRGILENFRDVYGRNIWTVLIPIKPKHIGAGFRFHTRKE